MSQQKVTAYFSSRKKASGLSSLNAKGLQSVPEKIRLSVEPCVLKDSSPVTKNDQTKLSTSPLTSGKILSEYRTPKRKRNDKHLQNTLQQKKRRISSALEAQEQLSSKILSLDHESSTPERKSSAIKKRLDLGEGASPAAVTQLHPVKITISKDEIELPTLVPGLKSNIICPTSQASCSSDENSVFTPPTGVSGEVKRNSPVDIAYFLATADYPAPISPLPPSPGSPAIVTKSKTTKSVGVDPIKLNPDEVKARLGKCDKLKELQARLSKVSNCATQLRQFKKKLVSPQLTKFAGDVEIPLEKKNVDKILPKIESLPAYQRFHNLASATTPSLTIPHKYKVLEEMFRSVDQVVNLKENRKELCTFAKLRDGVHVIMNRSFDLHNLGQISYVFPEAYIIRQEKASNYFQSKTGDYILTVTGNLKYRNTETTSDMLPQSAGHNVIESENVGRTFGAHPTSMTSNVLLERRNIFHQRLIEIMKEHHERFLSTLNPPMVVPKEKLTRWHPRFSVDEVLDIPTASLPLPPGVQFVTAKDVLEKARGLYGARVQKAMETVVQKQVQSSDCNSPSTVKPVASPLLKGIPQSLLDKIRAKEAANLEWEMTRNPENDEQLIMKARLPELARILRTYFITEKKAAIMIDDAVAKLMDSTIAALSTEEIMNHLTLLSKLVPSWLSIIHTKKGTYLKIDKSKNLNDVIGNFQNATKNSSH